jgi:PAS domain S-box-containing protein
MFDGAPHPYLVLAAGPDFKIVAVNDRYLAATGTARNEIRGRPLFEVFPDNPSERGTTSVSDLRTSLERVVRDRQPDVMGVQKYDIPDGHGAFETRYWSPVNTPISNAAGQVEFIIHHVEDVTEFVLLRKAGDRHGEQGPGPAAERADRMEAEVLRRAEEVKQANRKIKSTVKELERKKAELAEANARLEELGRAKSEFFANASHELRTPLTLILGPIEELLQDDSLSRGCRERLEVARRNAVRLGRQVDTVLEFSRIEGAGLATPGEPIDLSALTADLVSQFRSTCDRAGVALETDCPPLPGLVKIDPDAWAKIILNLVSNAVKFTEAGAIRVRLRALARAVELTVSDTGVGIPQEELPRIFERFHRVKGAAGRMIEGSGIGLALVQELARFYGGSIQVESTVGAGSVFKVVLPVGEFLAPDTDRATPAPIRAHDRGLVEEVERLAVPELPAAERPPAAAEPDGPLVLVAEDNADLRDYLVRILRGAGYRTRAVDDGETAFAACFDSKPAILLSDVMMSGLNGLDLTRRLRSNPRTMPLPIVLVSARAGETARIEGFNAGADEYLEKPFASAELIARIEAAVRLAQARRELAMKDRRLSSIVASAMDGIVSINERQQIVLFNAAAARMFGVGEKEAIGRPLGDFIPEAYRAAHEAHVRLFAKTSISGRSMGQFGRLTALRADGTVFPIDASISRSRLDGEVLLTVVLRDVSARVAMEEELERKRREAEAATRAKAAFLANMSHEIRTPLTSIIGYSGLLGNMKDLPAPARSHIDRIVTGGQTLLSVVNDILDFSKMEAGQVDLDPRPFDPRAFVHEAVNLVRAQAEAKGLKLDVNIAEAVPPWVCADSDRLRQILLNLLSNAIKFTAVGGVALDVDYMASSGGKLSVSVTDTGVGIPQSLVERLFQRFSQGDSSTARQFGGTGLGLAISKSLAELMGGAIGVRSREGEGSTFWFTVDAPIAEQAEPTRTEDEPRMAPARLLLVDDVSANRDLVAAMLEPFDIEIVQASSGAAAIEQAAAQPFDLILMDVQMPGMDGMAATAAIRRSPGANRDTPILALTADVMPEQVRACRNAGMSDHLGKPIDPRTLLTKIAEWTATNARAADRRRRQKS